VWTDPGRAISANVRSVHAGGTDEDKSADPVWRAQRDPLDDPSPVGPAHQYGAIDPEPVEQTQELERVCLQRELLIRLPAVGVSVADAVVPDDAVGSPRQFLREGPPVVCASREAVDQDDRRTRADLQDVDPMPAGDVEKTPGLGNGRLIRAPSEKRGEDGRQDHPSQDEDNHTHEDLLHGHLPICGSPPG
jgi:hypothetical protein